MNCSTSLCVVKKAVRELEPLAQRWNGILRWGGGMVGKIAKDGKNAKDAKKMGFLGKVDVT
jgi:hypothetical protein